MNRRSFITLLGASAPALFLPKLIKPAWKAPKWGPVQFKEVQYCVVNPDYVNAKYEWAWVSYYGWDRMLIGIPWPVRGNEFCSEGGLIPIPPFIMKSNPDRKDIIFLPTA